MTDPEELPWNRRLLTIAVRDYEYSSDDFAKKIEDQVAVLTTWLTDPALGDRRFAHEQVHPLTRDDINDFAKVNKIDKAGPGDVLVLYVTGHGIKGESGHHFLLTRDSNYDSPLTTCYRTSDLLGAALSSDAQHVLIFVDSCYSGALEAEWATISKDLHKSRRTIPTLIVIASANFDEEVRIGEFAGLLQRVYERLVGPAQLVNRYLTPLELWTEISSACRESPVSELPVVVWMRNPAHSEGTPCLPNPGYRERSILVGRSRQQVALTSSELLNYWIPRASGRAGRQDLGWYFSGRAAIMQSVTRFLASGEGILAITGVAGSGKSAILARAVTLSDSLFRRIHPEVPAGVDPAVLPPEGCVDAAVLARDKDTQQVCGELLVLLGGDLADSGDTYDQLRDHLLKAAKLVTIVVDGVDEATHPGRLINEALGPLARIRDTDEKPVVRLLLGIRSEAQHPAAEEFNQGLLDLLESAAEPCLLTELRTDQKPSVTEDIAAYLAALLGASGPYEGDVSPQDLVVQTVASTVSPSFLDAQLAGQRLRDADSRQDISDVLWLTALADGTVSLFRADLADTARALKRPIKHVLAVLRATAFAQGLGIPWAEVWPTVATALLDEPMDDCDQLIQGVLHSRLNGYLAKNVEDGRIVHRPNHERVAEELRDNADALMVEFS